MPNIVYHLPDGTSSRIDVAPGQSVKDGSVNNNLVGIVAECGGNCSCGTCHVHLAKEYEGFFADVSDEEKEVLEFLDGVDDESRLACQLIVREFGADIHVRVVDSR
ncbi:2Fe-2S iron-sulfur cluster-binding protein [Rhodococcus qingshengii]|jgi:2Fe-2S ferredoxin|uniref:2Fe-2S iron-sulfur cluster-binding protein n=1 Tax=Rhodococcus TaxID=1827 RepID=UPI001F36D2AF|nr:MULTISPECIES: 2Fe-2S iron-sulfur cluster-binding protein [Rhodococcus]MCE4268444.1 (2Fe-2S)-binding protein [Rhodococcus globerulus]MDJ0490708.1 2Fe-2S iron-sulfur cluster-binding protein [Rhodococcus qingshengii]